MRARTADACTCCAHARAHVGARSGAHASVPNHACEPFPISVDRLCLGAQAFQSAKAFNANIGAWNTAAVSIMQQVCAAFPARQRATACVPDALGRASMQRGRLCAAAPPTRARARARAGTRLRGAMGVGMAARRRDSKYMRFDIYASFIYIYIYVYSRTGRVYVYVYQCAC